MDHVAKEKVEMKFCKKNDQLTNIFTKALPKKNFHYMRNIFGITSLVILEGVFNIMLKM